MQSNVCAAGVGGEAHRHISLHKRQTARQLNVYHAVVVKIRGCAERFGKALHQYVSLVPGAVCMLTADLDIKDTVIKFGDFSYGGVEIFHLGDNRVVYISNDGIEAVGGIVECGCQQFTALDYGVAKYEIGGAGRKLLPGIEVFVDIGGKIVIGYVEHPFQFEKGARLPVGKAEIDVFVFELSLEEYVVIASDIVYLDPLSDEKISEINGRGRARVRQSGGNILQC